MEDVSAIPMPPEKQLHSRKTRLCELIAHGLDDEDPPRPADVLKNGRLQSLRCYMVQCLHGPVPMVVKATWKDFESSEPMANNVGGTSGFAPPQSVLVDKSKSSNVCEEVVLCLRKEFDFATAFFAQFQPGLIKSGKSKKWLLPPRGKFEVEELVSNVETFQVGEHVQNAVLRLRKDALKKRLGLDALTEPKADVSVTVDHKQLRPFYAPVMECKYAYGGVTYTVLMDATDSTHWVEDSRPCADVDPLNRMSAWVKFLPSFVLGYAGIPLYMGLVWWALRKRKRNAEAVAEVNAQRRESFRVFQESNGCLEHLGGAAEGATGGCASPQGQSGGDDQPPQKRRKTNSDALPQPDPAVQSNDVVPPPRDSAKCSLETVPPNSDDFWALEEELRAHLQGINQDYVAKRIKKQLLPLTFVLRGAQKVENPVLARRFAHYHGRLKQDAPDDDAARVRVAFHGTHPKYIRPICQTSLLRFGHPLNGCKAQVDPGWFGANTKGVYVSRYADYTLKYSNRGQPLEPGDRVKIIRFKALPGRSKHIKQICEGIDPTPGYHSHSSPNRLEWYLFDEDQLLPDYVLEVEAIENHRYHADDGVGPGSPS